MTVLIDKPEVNQIDATLLVEELIEKLYYSYSQGLVWSWKSRDWFWLMCDMLQYPGVYIYTWSLDMNSTRARSVTIFGTKNENIPNLR